VSTRNAAGRQDHQDAEEAEDHDADPARRHAFAEKHHGQQRRIGRHREFEREHRGERQQRQADGPQILRAEMHGVAHDMQAGATHRQGAQEFRLQYAEHQQDRQSAGTADRQDFEDF
jgi:hypothetical protein